MSNLLKKYPVVITLSVICLLFAIITSFFPGMYDLFAFHSKPFYLWQYVSGTFMHGSKGAPLWFLWVHLSMNLLMIIPFGHVLEAQAGFKNTLLVFLVSMLLSSAAFQVLLYGQDELGCGISTVGYAFVAGGIMHMRSLWKAYSLRTRTLYLLLIVFALVMLLPTITGWVSTCLHLTGMISYFIVYFALRRFSNQKH